MNWMVNADFPTPLDKLHSDAKVDDEESVSRTTTTDDDELVLPEKIGLHTTESISAYHTLFAPHTRALDILED